MVYDLEKENKEIQYRYKDLISNTYRTLDEEQNKLIRKAFDIALDAHKDQRRKTGEPYIYHPIEVAKIVANEIGLGATSIACALLHDVIEDSEYTYEDIKKIFGQKIAPARPLHRPCSPSCYVPRTVARWALSISGRLPGARAA